MKDRTNRAIRCSEVRDDVRDAFTRLADGTAPFEELWFIELSLGPERGLWLRYVLADHPEGRQCEVWAVATDRGRIVADKRVVDWLPPAGALFKSGAGRLSRSRATGSLDAIQWDLGLIHTQQPVRLIPRPFERVGRTYVPLSPRLFASGVVTVAGETWELRGAHGVLGHIYGKRNRTAAWAWAHCGHFDVPGVQFEGLSVRLGARGVTTPPLTVIRVTHGDRVFAFRGRRDLLATESELAEDAWRFTAVRDGAVLAGECRFDDAPMAVVRYARRGRPDLYCRNVSLGTLRLVLREPNGQQHEWLSRRCAFERVGTERPDTVHLD